MIRVLIISLIILCHSTLWAGRSFNGSSDNINFGTVALFKLIGDMTWMAWIKINASTTTDMVIIAIEGSTGEAEADNSVFYVATDATVRTDFRYIHEYGTGNNESTTSATGATNDVWFHFAITRNVATNVVLFYIDGVASSPFNYTNDPTSTGTNLNYRLGTRSDGTSNSFAGELAEVALYDRVLTEAEIDDIIANGQGQEPDYIHYSKLCGFSSPEPDESTNNNDGVLTGTTQVTHPVVGCTAPGIRRAQPMFFP